MRLLNSKFLEKNDSFSVQNFTFLKNWHVGPLNVRVQFMSGTFLKGPRWTESWINGHSRPVQKLDRSSLVCQDKLLILIENIFRAEFLSKIFVRNFWCYKIIKLINFIWIIFLWIWRRVTRTSYFIKDTPAIFKESVIKECFLNWFSSVVSDWSILECQFKN